MHPSQVAAATTITINISQSQIAGLNLGQLIGNIEGTVTNLNASGHAELAAAIKRLTEAVGAETTLRSDEAREAVELVSALSEELTRPSEAARPGVVRTVWRRLGQIVSTTAAAQGAYEAVKLAARTLGYELP
jgi:hypothetical protein